jgi:5-methylcytosine-specific restriction endonuclease McrA
MSTIPHRAELLAVIGAPCPYCGQAMQIPDRPPSRDHIRPRSKGYSLDGNRALVCQQCNTDKGSLSLGQWLTRLSRAGDPRADHVAEFIKGVPSHLSPLPKDNLKPIRAI